MYDFSVFEKARTLYSIPELPFLDSQREQLLAEKPYVGLKILHNIPLTLATVFKIEALALGGADVTTTCIKILPPEKRAIELLEQAHFKVQLEHNFEKPFDFHLDCCGELLDIMPPKMGAVELTQTGSKRYETANVTYPMVSVDDSPLKVLETFFGTGDGFSRAIHHHAGSRLQDKSFVLFGYGKVGQGIVYALRKFTKNITVISLDEHPSLVEFGVTYINPANKALAKKAIHNAWCAITATGVNGLITDYYHFKKEDFGSCLLTNMGADDEYGDNFKEQDIAFNKKPFNFSLEYPTSLHYLDPIFYSHNAAIDLILSKKMNAGYNPYPHPAANQILERWQSIYQENIPLTLLSTTE